MAEQEKTRETLAQRAESLTNEVQRELCGMAGFMIPPNVRVIIQRMAGLVEDMARQLDTQKPDCRPGKCNCYPG